MVNSIWQTTFFSILSCHSNTSWLSQDSCDVSYGNVWIEFLPSLFIICTVQAMRAAGKEPFPTIYVDSKTEGEVCPCWRMRRSYWMTVWYLCCYSDGLRLLRASWRRSRRRGCGSSTSRRRQKKDWWDTAQLVRQNWSQDVASFPGSPHP